MTHVVQPHETLSARSWFVPLMPLVAALLAGCASNTSLVSRSVATGSEVTELVKASPHVALYVRQPPQPVGDALPAVYYKKFTEFNRPYEPIWEHHYVIEEGSEPQKKFRRIARVMVVKRVRQDRRTVEELREVAQGLGGEAVIEVYRRPLMAHNLGVAPVTGYIYQGEVVQFR